MDLPPQQLWPRGGRAVLDVTAAATRMDTIIKEAMWPEVGTYAATPIFGGLVTLLNNERKRQGKAPLGFLNPALYKLDRVGTDITAGNHKVKSSPAGFSATTG